MKTNSKANSKANENEIEELQLYTHVVIEQFFPKGKCKERGQAIVMYAEMLIRIKNNFRIIPRTDSPEKHIEYDYKAGKFLRLKWRDDK